MPSRYFQCPRQQKCLRIPSSPTTEGMPHSLRADIRFNSVLCSKIPHGRLSSDPITFTQLSLTAKSFTINSTYTVLISGK